MKGENTMVSIFPLLQAAATFSKEYTGAWGMLGAGVGAGLAVIGAGIGIGRLAGQAMDGMARSAEMAARIQTARSFRGAHRRSGIVRDRHRVPDSEQFTF